MKIYICYDRCHHKIQESIIKMMEYNKITHTISNNLDSLDDTYNLVFCIDKFYPPESFSKTCKIIYGPQFFVFPDDISHPIFKYEYDQERFFYNVLSSWNQEVFNEFNFTKMKCITCPLGIDINNIPIRKEPIGNKVMIYFKRRYTGLLDYVKSFLKDISYDYIIFSYNDTYKDEDFKLEMDKCKFIIWIGTHESQGFAFQEALARNIPILLWDVDSMYDEMHWNNSIYAGLREKEKKLLATTANVWSDECGVRFTDSSEFESKFIEINRKYTLGVFNPRKVIANELSLEKTFNNILDKVNINNQNKYTTNLENKMHIVYSFIGTLPEYIIDTVWQSRLFFKDDIWLITDDIESEYIKKISDMKMDVKIINYNELIDDDIKNLNAKHSDVFCYVEGLKGREKLFMRSFERFYLLRNLMKLQKQKNVLFLELDNTIYDTPYKWLHKLEKYNISAMGHNDNSIIKHDFNCESLSTGICYVRDYESISHLCEYYNTYFDSMLINKDVFPCEMNATFRYFKKYPERVETLPVIWKTNNLPNYYYNKLDTYESIFDGASLGVLLFGHDTYHTNGKIVLGERVKGTNMDFRSYNFKWEYDEQWRKIPYIYRKDTNKWYKINNLHIHSKNLKASLSVMY